MYSKGGFMGDKVFTMRIDEDLLEKVRKSADKNKRSLAKEIEFALSNWYDNNPEFGMPITLPNDVAKEFFQSINEQLEQHKKLIEELKKEKN